MSTNVFVEVDLTLVDADGQMLDGAREALVQFRTGGCSLFLWSAAGAEYARLVAKRHDLTELFEGFSAKPDIAIDDMPETPQPSRIYTVNRDVSWLTVVSDILASKDEPPAQDHLVSSTKAHILKALAHVRSSAHLFKDLNVTGVSTAPIPFFGDISSAEILTVGVNPSWTEFKDRLWPALPPSADYLECRLRNYFQLRVPPPHPWFGVWEEALNNLEWSSYRTNAAHIDISPRPTPFMRHVNIKRFQEMATYDIGLLFEALSICSRAKLLMIAGTVTKDFWIDEFLAKEAPKHGYELVDKPRRSSGQARVGFYKLASSEKTLPVFFCGVGPAADTSYLLPQRVVEHRKQLLSYLNCDCLNNN